MEKRAGGKFSGNHTTLTDLAAILADIAVKLPDVRKISPGFIRMNEGTGRAERRVKFIDKDGGGVLLKIRQNCSVQEVFIMTDDSHKIKLALARAARNRGIHISFQRPS